MSILELAPKPAPLPDPSPKIQLPNVKVDCDEKEEKKRKKPCFAAGTPFLMPDGYKLIETPDGYKLIEQFQAGDKILSRSELNFDGPLEVKIVEEIFVGESAIVKVQVGGQSIRTTAEHPFFVRGKCWLGAKDIQSGDELVSRDGQWSKVEGVIDLAEAATVYHMRISDYHTYFVGCDEWGYSVWAHNACVVVHRWDNGNPRVKHFSVEVRPDNGLSFVHECQTVFARRRVGESCDGYHPANMYVKRAER